MSFVDLLLHKYASQLSGAVTHQLTQQLCSGTLPDHVLFTYLTQDLMFFNSGLQVFGKALAQCDDARAAIVLGKQIGFICNDENDYFKIVLDQLRDSVSAKVADMTSSKPPVLPAVAQYIDFMATLNTYPEVITFMYAMEKVYLDWAEETELAADLPYKHKEWIVLHSGEAFTAWTAFLKSEVERVVDDSTAKDCERVFHQTLELEIAFFQECYRYE
ncbi:heme oxygenase-like protein [Suhomyces tanzawaensis NRRL Y-17324]|uniref:Heme oxygenase-like protein n=1 Tax=Suhomyces tanzawaensis NRRL Y-17324 TaxID=984487 RepID=A0A1E4SNL5_9ASCO|nr:heme oxygenase-like protein [Suhomyces tanzawaensis NRRL Y-17324]ODV81109.1 heme oxygenase-like protein [Suhomyces tanzawaensis NRRL Y-17324]